MTQITAVIDGVPVAKARPRITMAGRRARAYTPKKSADWERHIQSAIDCKPLDGPLSMILTFSLPVPQSWSKKKTSAALSGEVMPISRPDLDNYAKAVLDALNGRAYHDDSQVVCLTARKQYAATPSVMIEITPWVPSSFTDR